MEKNYIAAQTRPQESIFKESDFFIPNELKASATREKKYVTAQAKAIALVLLLALIVSGAAALIVTSLADSYSETHRNAAVVTVKHKNGQNDAVKSLIGASVADPDR